MMSARAVREDRAGFLVIAICGRLQRFNGDVEDESRAEYGKCGELDVSLAPPFFTFIRYLGLKVAYWLLIENN